MNQYYVARVKDGVKQLGTLTEFDEGDLVIATDATNLPQGGYFIWDISEHEAVINDSGNSMHVDADDLEFL